MDLAAQVPVSTKSQAKLPLTQPTTQYQTRSDTILGANNSLHFPISIAPMMDYTDRHYRMLMRLLTKRTVLYTEMISTGAIVHGERERHLAFSAAEKPLVLQVGGDNPAELAECTRIAADYGYDEININTGCPSERVQQGSFGAALMAKSELVAEGVAAMCATNTIAVSVKCRIGIDGSKVGLPIITDYASLARFARLVFDAGASRLTVHARIAILGGLSPKENRNIPPLQYPLVYDLAKECSNKRIEINGGIQSIAEVEAHLARTGGVMIGRAAVDNPMMFAGIDEHFAKDAFDSADSSIGVSSADLCRTLQIATGAETNSVVLDSAVNAVINPRNALNNTLSNTSNSNNSRIELALCYATYLEGLSSTVYARNAIRHVLPLFNGMRGARLWRRAISEMTQGQEAPSKAITYALQYVQ